MYKIIYLLITGLIILITYSIITSLLMNYSPLERNYATFDFENSYSKNRTYNIILEIIFPNILVIFFYYSNKFNKDFSSIMYLSVLSFYLLRWLLVIITGRFLIINKKMELFVNTIGILLAFSLHQIYFIKKINIMPSINDLINNFWIAILIFTYEVIKKILDNYDSKDSILKEKYIKKNFYYLKKKYNDTILECLGEGSSYLKSLVYSIMIYENFNRPKYKRIIETFYFFLLNILLKQKKSMTLGVMQVSTLSYINDYKSIDYGIKKIKSLKDELFSSVQKERLKDEKKSDPTLEEIFIYIISNYNRGHEYFCSVSYIKDILDEYPENKITSVG